MSEEALGEIYQKAGERIRRDLCFSSWKELEGLKILDLGSGESSFGMGARSNGLDVVSLDISLERLGRGRQKTSRLQADASKLPFSDGTFDLVVSSLGPPFTSFGEDELRQQSQEIIRYLRDGGEFRMFPPLLEDIVLEVWEECGQSLDAEKLEEMMLKKSLPRLKKYFPGGNQHKGKVFIYKKES